MSETKCFKRARERNWSEPEKEMLIELVRRHLKTINDRRNDAKTLSRKKAAWSDIKYNMEAAGYNRGLLKLKHQWVRMKFYARKNCTAMKVAPITKHTNHSQDDLRRMMSGEFFEDDYLINNNPACIDINGSSEMAEELPEVKVEPELHTPLDSYDKYQEEQEEDPIGIRTTKNKIKPPLKKKGAADVIHQRWKQIFIDKRNNRELQKLRVKLLENQISHANSLFEVDMQIKLTILETEKLKRDKEKVKDEK